MLSTYKGNGTSTPIFAAAEKGYLDYISWDESGLGAITSADRGYSPLDYSAKHGQLGYIPRQALTVGMLRDATYEGKSRFELAAANGQLSKVPAWLWNELMEQDTEYAFYLRKVAFFHHIRRLAILLGVNAWFAVCGLVAYATVKHTAPLLGEKHLQFGCAVFLSALCYLCGSAFYAILLKRMANADVEAGELVLPVVVLSLSAIIFAGL